MPKLTKEQINADLAPRNIWMKGEYKNAHAKAEFECANGHTWEAKVCNVRTRSGCPHCSKHRPLTPEIINADLAAEGRGIRLKSGFIDSMKKAVFICEQGHEWEAKPNGIRGGNGCPKCAGGEPLTAAIVMADLLAEGRGIELISPYVNSITKARFKCDQGHEWEATPGMIRSGRGCPKCADFGIWRSPIGYVYVMAYSSGLTKIGISHSPSKRLTQLRRATREAVQLIALYSFGDGTGRSTWEAEQAAHAHFAERHAGLTGFDGARELFNITPAEACDYLKAAGGKPVRKADVILDRVIRLSLGRVTQAE
ncbi:GIY-YIG nuclease family protein [Salmonella enterica]|nr:GIY-YIG nuclease family protein [Salmonella enterica]